MKDKTAVEWLVKMLHSPVCVGFIQGRRQIPHDIIQQAKQMEKEQITKAYANGVVNEISIYNTITGEEFYNQTYGK